MLLNPSIDIQVKMHPTGTNSFWMAAYFGHGKVMKHLAKAGIDIFNTDEKYKNNALHIAV
jgi:hypothetical protein